MATLYVRQLNDGEQSGDEVPCLPQYEGQPVDELFARKVASHRRYGWTVDEETTEGFHAWKLHDHPNQPDRVDRYFELRG